MKATPADLVVVGAGPGGYAAAFYAADRGKKVILVERDKRLGGVCLNHGCIPSKALLHNAHLIAEAKAAFHKGIRFGPARVDLKRMREWKDSILEKLGQGLRTLAEKREVEILEGRGHFEGSDTLRVETAEGQKFIQYGHAIIAVGAKPSIPPAFDLGSRRIMTSTEALELQEIPKNLLVVGGGYIGLELGTVYEALGSAVALVEALPCLLTGADPDLVRPVVKYAESHFRAVRLNTKVVQMATHKKRVKVTMESEGKKIEELYEGVLVSVGRVPNCEDLGLENTKVITDERGFIQVNARRQTEDPKIYAIGDVVGGAMLAHKAAKEARVAVEALLGENSVFQDVVMPAVVFTHPEVAWCGLTEAEAREKGRAVKVARFPWAASGRAMTLGHPEGLTKLIVDPDTERLLGVGIVGCGAGDLISEGVLAVEMGATARDLAESVHPHPTLSETLMESAEVFYGHATHTFSGRRHEA